MHKTTLNASEMKRRNRSKVLTHIREQGCSRIEIARRTGLTRAAISVIVEEMLHEGILLEGETQENAAGAGAAGRRATQLMLNPHAYHILGLDIARRDCTLALTDFRGAILRDARIPTRSDAPEATMASVVEAAKALLATSPQGALLGMGVTAPGPLDSLHGKLLAPPNFGAWRDIPLATEFTAAMGCPVLVENNSAALALAEKACGLGRQYRSFLAVVVDTGIGGGFVTDRRLYKGGAGFGSEVGHTSICVDGPQCTCGNFGCAELYASIPNIVRVAQSVSPDLTDWRSVVDAAALGRADALQVLDQEAAYLTCMVVNAIQILDVQQVIFFGDICYRFGMIGERIEALVNARVAARTVRAIRVQPSALTAPAAFASANLVLEAYVQEAR